MEVLTIPIYFIGFGLSYAFLFYMMKKHMLDETKLSELNLDDLAALLFFPGAIAWLWPIVLPFAVVVTLVRFFAKKLDI